MHKKILEKATLPQLVEFVEYAIPEVKSRDEELYKSLEMCLYKKVYGYHFSDWKLKEALDSMVNEDGTKGGHWTLDQTTMVAKQNDITFKSFNEYDWCYVMNMIYSDYYGAVPDELSSYVKLAKKFLEDKDSCDGKAFSYYVTMTYNK